MVNEISKDDRIDIANKFRTKVDEVTEEEIKNNSGDNEEKFAKVVLM